MSEGVVVALCAVLIAVGMIGIVLPVLPGLFLTLLAVFIWAVATGGSTAWTIFGIAALVWAIGVTAQFLIPGKRLKAQGVGMTTMLLAVVGGIIGFFVIPVIGAPVGFVLAILLIELTRTQDLTTAWARTKQALIAIVHSMGIELITALIIAVLFVVGVLRT